MTILHACMHAKRELYRQRVKSATLEKLAKLIHVTALLLQTKVYLFWKIDSIQNDPRIGILN